MHFPYGPCMHLPFSSFFSSFGIQCKHLPCGPCWHFGLWVSSAKESAGKVVEGGWGLEGRCERGREEEGFSFSQIMVLLKGFRMGNGENGYLGVKGWRDWVNRGRWLYPSAMFFIIFSFMLSCIDII
jgi:hypothetical protein